MHRIERERQEREDSVTRKHRERQEDKERGAAAFYALLDRLPGAERDVAVIRRVVERLVAGGYCGVDSDMLLALPYREYLDTNHWNDVRMRTMERAEFRCMLCNSEGELHTHHRTYENLGREKDGDTICLCDECHKTFHERHTADHQFAT